MQANLYVLQGERGVRSVRLSVAGLTEPENMPGIGIEKVMNLGLGTAE